MDIIYTDENQKEIGLLDCYDLDVDVADQKDFELRTQSDDLQMGSVWYAEGTEFGGVVKYIKQQDEETIYKGFNARGLLNNKIIMPDGDYKVVSGNYADILTDLINDELFVVDESDIEIPEFQFTRFCTAYEGITDMLSAYDMTPVFKWHAGKIHITAEIKTDYSDIQKYGAGDLQNVEIDKMNANHIICIGSGEMSARKVIHLFVDENGGIMPYAKTDNPVQDSDYILDLSSQQIFGTDEIVEVYDFGNAETVENYILQTAKPKNWSKKFSSYFVATDSGYDEVEGTDVDILTLTKSKPADWAKNYGAYCTSDGKAVGSTTKRTYEKLTKQPADWAKNYTSYFTLESDGTEKSYESVVPDVYYKYILQTMKPSDWDPKNYYKKVTEKGKTKYVTADYDEPFKIKITKESVNVYESAGKSKVIATIKNKDGLYTVSKTSGNYGYLPNKKGWISMTNGDKQDPVVAWAQKKFYTKKSFDKAPAFSSKYYRLKSEVEQAPAWASNKYYTKATVEQAPDWIENTYYTIVYDNYAELVSGGLSRIVQNTTSAEIALSDNDYKIGDIVAGKKGKLEAVDEITNIIVKVTDGDLEIEYKIGDD